MDTKTVISVASGYIKSLVGNTFDVLTVSKPISPDAALHLAKVISKLSPVLGNLIEFNTVEILNAQPDFGPFGKWKRQDPGFPDTIFDGVIFPIPGFEIKAWFPLATEMTARFKDSQNHFAGDNTYVAILAWLPEFLIFGKPQILGACVVSGLSIAKARDIHYHNPPDYIVLEPEDTRDRTRNLQQTNTSGYKWQGNQDEFVEAKRLIESWGKEGFMYQPTVEYQKRLRELTSRYKYRLDTNFAKIDRIEHDEIEGFKRSIYATEVHGMTIGQWNKLISSDDNARIRHVLEQCLGIKKEDVGELLD